MSQSQTLRASSKEEAAFEARTREHGGYEYESGLDFSGVNAVVVGGESVSGLHRNLRYIEQYQS